VSFVGSIARTSTQGRRSDDIRTTRSMLTGRWLTASSVGLLGVARINRTVGEEQLMPTVTLQPTEAKQIDAFVQDGSTTDRSTSEGLRVGFASNSKEYRTLMEWDLSQVLPKSISATGIRSVTLTMNHKEDTNFRSTHTKDLYIQVVNGSFSEATTWVYRDGSSEAWTAAGGDVQVAPGTYTQTYTGDSDLVVTSSDASSGNLLHFMRDAITNEGMKLRIRISMVSGGTNRNVNFWSANAGSESDRPKLDITYTGVPGIGFKTVTTRLSSLRRRKRAGRKK